MLAVDNTIWTAVMQKFRKNCENCFTLFEEWSPYLKYIDIWLLVMTLILA